MNCSLNGRLVHRLVSSSCHRRTIASTAIRWTVPPAITIKKPEAEVRSNINDKQPIASVKPSVNPVVKQAKTPLNSVKHWLKLFKDAIVRKQEAADQKVLQLEAFVLRKMPLLARITPSRDTESTPKFGKIDINWRHWTTTSILAFLYFAVGYLWTTAKNHDRLGDYAPLDFMQKHFMSCWENLQEGRWWTLFTASISHENIRHFQINNICLWVLSPIVLGLLGCRKFITLYVFASAISSLTSIAWKQFDIHFLHRQHYIDACKYQPIRYSGLGASGSLYSLLTVMACLTPHTIFRFFFIIPMPAYVLVSGIFAYDSISALTRPARRNDSACHVGGVIAGILFWRFGMKRVRYASLSV